MAPEKHCRISASPNLALVKYWGKANVRQNLPATPSLGITLGNLTTTTDVSLAAVRNEVLVNGTPAPPERFRAFFDHIAERHPGRYFRADSTNSFPTAAGLASSSSGFAALAYGGNLAGTLRMSDSEVSAWARVGSASAARSVFGGFVSLPASAESAVQLYGPDHWPELRVIVVAVKTTPKKTSSRMAMELSRNTSPYYESWITSSKDLYRLCEKAVGERDIEALGEVMRQSYLNMFATMFSSSPPVFYWEPDSVKLIRLCENLRSEGIQAWETMDAGPQVKIACLQENMEAIVQRVTSADPNWTIITSGAGGGPVEIP